MHFERAYQGTGVGGMACINTMPGILSFVISDSLQFASPSVDIQYHSMETGNRALLDLDVLCSRVSVLEVERGT